jgi:hypothetical protein
MALTSAQKIVLKAAIAAVPAWDSLPNTPDGNFALAELLKAQAVPAYTAWRTSVSIAAVGGAFNGTELSGLTTANQTRLQTVGVYFAGGLNPSNVDVRSMFDDIFSGAGGANTRARLLALWKRLASEIEKVFATGIGSDAAPATLTFEGGISYQDVQDARNS